jgi:hypothetical protein
MKFSNMPLKDADCRAAKPRGKPQKSFDGGGLYLWISTSGKKAWRLAYRFEVLRDGVRIDPASVFSLQAG